MKNILYIILLLVCVVGCHTQKPIYYFVNSNTPEVIVDSISNAEGLDKSDYRDWKWQMITLTNDSVYTKQYMRTWSNAKYMHIMSVIVNPTDTVIKYRKEKK